MKKTNKSFFTISFVASICLLFSLTTLTIPITVTAQNVAAWHDRQDRFQFFDGEKIVQLDHNPTDFFRVGDGFVVYLSSADEMVYYHRNGHKEILHLRNVAKDYTVTRNLILLNVGDVFQAIDHKDSYTLSLQNDPPMDAGDNIVAYIDFHGELMVFHDGEKKRIDGFRPEDFKVSDNSCAFVDRREFLRFYENGNTWDITDQYPNQFMPGNDLILYVDTYDEFKFWRNDETVDISGYPPESYKVGDNIAAYVDDRKSFYIIDEGEMEPKELDFNAPNFYDVIDNTVVFVDANLHLNVHYKGKVTKVAAYETPEYQYADGVIAFLDHNRRLKAFYNGEIIDVSSDIVTSFKVFGQVIIFEIGNGAYQVFYNGQLY